LKIESYTGNNRFQSGVNQKVSVIFMNEGDIVKAV